MGRILVRGEPGHEIVVALAPHPAIGPGHRQTGKRRVLRDQLNEILHIRGIETLIVCSVTTEVCVHTTVREAMTAVIAASCQPMLRLVVSGIP